ncbi:phage tail tape measure protein [Comamonas terrigena]|uniref:phage tail tape measure protein n=1 Tax=Comamonas terrigena TaxID=32013 RepID=UPI00244AFDCD|nr:phage tail tape measure protein [Comamonas terrigena]MDH1499346.1 phage tail tape measure protein [Comamonas terrigena]
MADKFTLKALITGVDKLSPMFKGIQKNANTLKKQLESSGLGKMSLGDMAGAGAFAAPIIGGIKAAMDFESKMADVKKVVDFDTPADFAKMQKDVLGLSRELPMAANGIAQIVAAGGQAGIPREELKGFAKDAVMMGVAFDQTADQSGQMMATWRTAFKMGQAEVVTLADQINYLGNTGPANTKQISAIVTSIGPLGEVAGLASAQIAAMGATLAGVGIAEDVAATGMKNFMLTLTAGSAATKGQQNAFKALRLDAKQMATGMQKDSQGTIMKVLSAVSKVDKSKQAAVLTELFGKESVGAIAPMLTNLDKLAVNFDKVSDSSKYAGSMGKEYEARSKTTAFALQQLTNRAVEVGIVVGNVLLPPFNDFMATIGPVVSSVAELAEANPWLVKTVIGAAAGFVALRLGAMGATFALKALLTVGSLTPLGLAIRGIALLAGVVISNWGTIGPYFKGMWGTVGPLFEAGWELLKMAFDWSPLGLIVKHWEPIMAWFKAFWAKLEPIIQPIMKGAQWLGGKAQAFVTDRKVAAAVAEGEADGSDRRLAVPRTATSPVQPRQSPLMPGGGSTKQQLQGEMVVRFDNAPPGMRVTSATSSQPGVQMFTEVGRRSLSGG